MLWNIDSVRIVEVGFAAHVVAVKAAHHMQFVGDAERVGQLAQVFRTLAAFAGMAIVAQKAHEAGEMAFNMARLVQGQAQGAAALQERAQRRIHLDSAQRKHGTIRIE